MQYKTLLFFLFDVQGHLKIKWASSSTT